MTKTDLIFPAFSSRFVDFAIQFCFCCKFSFNEEWRSSHFWQCRPINSLLRIATNEIASFCINQITSNESNGFFSCKGGAKAGQKAGFRVILKHFEIKKAFRYYTKQIDSMLPCVWFRNRSQKTSKCGKNISDTLGSVRLGCHFSVLTTLWRHLWSITEQTHGNMESIC